MVDVAKRRPIHVATWVDLAIRAPLPANCAKCLPKPLLAG
jgi:hypothetical protein